MKTGEAAKRIGISAETIRNWLKREELQEFFTPGARGISVAHRVIEDTDILVLNTISNMRFENETWEAIVSFLETGQRITTFPQTPVTADPRTVSIQSAEQSARAAATMAERDTALTQVDKLQKENKELQQEVRQLSREVGRLEGRLETLQNNFITDSIPPTDKHE